MAVVYIWRVVEAAYFQEAPGDGASGVVATDGRREPIVEAPLALLIPTWVLVVANFYFGIDATFTVELAESAARTLFGLAP
jgi:multicomponent Na+:H+ antiporter subunit D